VINAPSTNKEELYYNGCRLPACLCTRSCPLCSVHGWSRCLLCIRFLITHDQIYAHWTEPNRTSSPPSAYPAGSSTPA